MKPRLPNPSSPIAPHIVAFIGHQRALNRRYDVEDKVLRTFGRLASPPVTDVEIDWGNADAQVAPRGVGPLFDGDVFSVCGRPEVEGQSVKLWARDAHGSVAFEATASL